MELQTHWQALIPALRQSAPAGALDRLHRRGCDLPGPNYRPNAMKWRGRACFGHVRSAPLRMIREFEKASAISKKKKKKGTLSSLIPRGKLKKTDQSVRSFFHLSLDMFPFPLLREFASRLGCI